MAFKRGELIEWYLSYNLTKIYFGRLTGTSRDNGQMLGVRWDLTGDIGFVNKGYLEARKAGGWRRTNC